MLQCHPHPGDFSDKSRPFHCCYFMGLQRKQGVPVNEGEQFDIRITVEEFKHNVNMYASWKPGMEIHVCHVKRRNIPNFVFPGGIRPSRPSKVTWKSSSSELKVSGHAQDNSCEGKAVSNGVDEGRKRKQVDNNVDNLRSAKCLPVEPPSVGGHAQENSCEGKEVSNGVDDGRNRKQVDYNVESNPRSAKRLATEPSSAGEVHEGSPVSTVSSCSIKGENMDTHSQADGFARCNPPNLVPSAVADTSSKEAESLAIEKIMSGPYVAHQAFPEELDELEDDFEYRNQVKDSRGNMKGSPIECSTANAAEAVPVPSSNGAGSSSGLYSNRSLEELEVQFTNLVTFYFEHRCLYWVLLANFYSVLFTHASFSYFK